MATQENLVRVSTRPLVLTVAVLSALAIGLVGVYTIQASAVPPTTNTCTPFGLVACDQPRCCSVVSTRASSWLMVGSEGRSSVEYAFRAPANGEAAFRRAVVSTEMK